MCAHNGESYALTVNGFQVEARYDAEEIRNVLDCLIDRLLSIRKKCGGKEKTVAFLSGPPGAGKSTLALSVSERARQRGCGYSFECLGLDGFHMTRERLEKTRILIEGKQTLLLDIKGAPETFDAEAFCETLRKVKSGKSDEWPVYDRRIHDVSDQMTRVTGDILLIEGNWLMYPGVWAEAREMCDLTVSLDEDDPLLKERLIERKMRGGKTKAEAEKWFESVDGANIMKYRKASDKAQIRIKRVKERLSLENEKG